MIEIANLTKKFGEVTVLDSLSFTVKQGEILGFLGPNGAGKTTTMKILTGFWPANGGTVKIADLDLNKHGLALRQRIGYLPEHVPLYEDMKVYEYLKFVAEIRGLEADKIVTRLKEVAKSCGLTKVIGQPISELSKGFRQRVGLAQAIMHDPDILILDEPTTGLDPNQIVEIRQLIKEIGQFKTVIFSTHILAEVSATCDRVLIINQGKIVAEGTPADLTKKLDNPSNLQLQIVGQPTAVLSWLQAFPNITQAELKNGKDAANSQTTDAIAQSYVLTTAPGTDPRASLVKGLVAQGWDLLELNQQQASLEDVFRQLTK